MLLLYPRRLDSLTICTCNYKGRTFSSVIQVLVQPGFKPTTFRTLVPADAQPKKRILLHLSPHGNCGLSQSFLCGISPTLSQRQRYFLILFIFIHFLIYESEELVTWFLVWMFRREKTGFQYTPVYVSLSAICFFSCWVFTEFEVFSRCAFSSRGK